MRTLLAGLGVVVSLATMYVGCGLSTKGNDADGFVGTGGGSTGTMTGAGGSGTPCMTQADCPQNTDCATYVCSESICKVMLLAEGTEVQNGMMVGDCHKIVCTANGVTTTKVAQDDPPASPDPCTTKSCDGDGNVVTTVAPEQTMCGKGLFCMAGKCVGCMAAEDCPAPPDLCHTVECNSMSCDYTEVPDDTEVGDNSVKTDCTHSICKAGVQINAPDTSEVPQPDAEPICTDDTCNNNGMAAYVPAMENMMCDAAAGPCWDPSLCNTGVCTDKPKPAGFITDSSDGDCKQDHCDGAGNLSMDPADDPPTDNDPSDCSVPICNNGMPSSMTLANGMACGGGSKKCCGGTCCNSGAICSGANGNTCCDSGKVCGSACCSSALISKCFGANNDMCCDTGIVCNNVCCNNQLAICAAGNCCNSGKACGSNCCQNGDDGCYNNNTMCCPTNRICQNATVCCPSGMVCKANDSGCQ